VSSDVYYPLAWLSIVVGLVPAIWFVLTYKPRRILLPEQIDASGWILGFVGLWLAFAAQLLIGVHVPSVASFAVSFTARAWFDALVIMRAIRFRQFRAGQGSEADHSRT
jgi:hypothetical protein